MLSYLWSLFGGGSSADSSSADKYEEPSGLLESDVCHHDLQAIGAEEREMEEQLQHCFAALKRARRQREALAEGYECLIMSTYDPLEHSVLYHVVNSNGPLFDLKSGSLERVRTEVDDDDVASEDLSEPDPSDYSDEEVARALRLGGQTVAISIRGKENEASGTDRRDRLPPPRSNQRRLVTVYELSHLTKDDFVNALQFDEWSSFYSLWRARRALTSAATRFEVLGRIEEECDRLDERLFELRIRLTSVKAKKKRADYQLESYAEAMSHNMYEAPAIEMSTAGAGSATALSVPRETDLV